MLLLIIAKAVGLLCLVWLAGCALAANLPVYDDEGQRVHGNTLRAITCVAAALVLLICLLAS